MTYFILNGKMGFVMTENASDPILIEAGARIRRTRLEAGLNLHDLARLSGVSIGALSHIETGKRDLRLTTLFKIAKALRIAPAALLSSFEALTDSTRDSGAPDAGPEGYDFGDYE